MEPLSALAVVCATLQFLDFGAKLITTARELYQSESGVSAHHSELQDQAQRLTDITDKFSLPELSDLGLRKIVSECKAVATELRLLSNDLQLGPPASPDRKIGGQIIRVFKSVGKSSKILMKSPVFEELKERMAVLRQEVHMYILYMLNERTSTIYQALDHLNQQNVSMGTNLIIQIKAAKNNIIDQIRKSQLSTSRATSPHTVESLMGYLHENVVDVKHKTDLLASMDFAERQDRRNHIHPATDNTLQWISSSSTNHSSGKTVQFTEWLKSREPGDNLFWISGKPGSGKSTLMKHLWTDHTVMRYLSEWASPKMLFKSQFYFWISGGSDMLKNEVGFLRALAFDILKSNPAVIQHACPFRWGRYTAGETLFDIWDTDELLQTINAAMNWEENNMKYFFFIDGVDEFKGPPEQIIGLIRRLPTSVDTKYCISSRKWNEFQSAFGEETGFRRRSIYLEELNTADIKTFVSKQLVGQEIFKRWTRENQQDSQKLVDTVVTKAAGVFLWVDLVVRSLIRGIKNEDSLRTLQERLTELPDDLNEYFERMLDSVEKVYRPDAAKIYQVMLRTHRQPYLVMFAFIEEKDPNFGALNAIEPASEMQVEGMIRKTQRRLNARCTDLLDIIESPKTDAYFQKKVDFLHRTVRDFIEEPKTKKRLQEWLSKDKKGEIFDASRYICQAIVAQAKGAPIRKEYLWVGGGLITELAEEFHCLEQDIILSWGPHGVQEDLKKEFRRAMTAREVKILEPSFEARPGMIHEIVLPKDSSIAPLETDSEGNDIPRVIVQDYDG